MEKRFMKRLLEGESVRLTAIEKEDIEKFTGWYNDTSFMRNYDIIGAVPKSIKEVTDILEDIEQSNDKYIFAVRNMEDNQFIGVTGFENILWNNGTALVYIGIGNQRYRGKGLGKEALYLTLDFGFEELNFHRIYLIVISYNKAAINLYESLGFVKEGTYREAVYRDGQRWDLYLYGILRPEWEVKKKSL
jgi:RimJ/RimL family protein N-acetyltransferase